MSDKGTDFFDPLDSLEGSSRWFETEAVCVDGLDSLDALFEESSNGSIISNLLDDSEDLEQGNSLALFNQQITDACNKTVIDLKRKLLTSPEQTVAVELSPRLAAVTISPRKVVKRRLFDTGDSGIAEDEASNSHEKVVVDAVVTDNVDSCNVTSGVDSQSSREEDVIIESSRRWTMLAKFKDTYGIKYKDLVRDFKSDKSCSKDWVLYGYNIHESLVEASKQLLQKDCQYVQLISLGAVVLYCLSFNCLKSRETLVNMFTKMLNCEKHSLICDPPKTRSVPVALYFYKKTFGNTCFTWGPMPDWMAKQALVSHEQATAESFKLSEMVQWAYDNDIVSEAEIAYRYACIAREDKNAAAFLQSNSQVKYVRDCCQMVKLYKRQEMNDMTMGEWIKKCSDACTEQGSWRDIAKYLRHQNINMISFLNAFKLFLQGRPKKNVILFYGPPDTGKSYLCVTLVRFLKGKVLSLQNKNSSFWLQPLADTKLGLIDDITFQGFQHIDTYLRNALDGNPINVDMKHRAPTQMRLPPLLMTSNINLYEEPSFKYLYSRITGFCFPNKMLFDDNDNVLYNINSGSWKSFFSHLEKHLELTSADSQDESGGLESSFRCTAGETIEYN